MGDDSLYDPQFVRSLFDEMATTYGVVNLLSSFGFTIWGVGDVLANYKSSRIRLCWTS